MNSFLLWKVCPTAFPPPPEKEIDRTLLDTIFRKTGNTSSTFLCNPFTWNEFSYALKSRKKDSTPGLDDFPYKLVINLHDDAKVVLLNIFNLLWETGLIPTSWKTQCVIPILKPDKPPDNSNSYRPISLSSCIGKLFEYMVNLMVDLIFTQSLIKSYHHNSSDFVKVAVVLKVLLPWSVSVISETPSMLILLLYGPFLMCRGLLIMSILRCWLLYIVS